MSKKKLQLLRELAMRIATRPCLATTALPQVKIAKVETPSARHPVLYNPSIVIVLQGSKKGYIGDKVCTYDADNYFVTAIPMQFEVETLATSRDPLISVAISIDLLILRAMVLELNRRPQRDKTIEAYYATPLTLEILDSLHRLLNMLAPASEGNQQSCLDVKMLGPSLLREIYYRVLQGPHGKALYELVTRHTHLSDMSGVIDLIHEKYATELCVEDMAKSLNMSSTAFHKHFKELTSSSPIQYVKILRLHKAKIFMVQDGLNASQAAEKVGYNSLSQFSREFKRMFGMSPLEEVSRTRALFGMDAEHVMTAV
ncbi:MAG: AraC family transcriptional regulator [Candidatus Obscuribacterales bacterium]|nr:AraC family transcriptional regulator [Candidatus Obscuribacterales bacterium]